MLDFQYPSFFLLLIPIIIIYIFKFINIESFEGVVRYSNIDLIPSKIKSRATFKNNILVFLNIFIFLLVILGLARPRLSNIISDSKVDIVDIMLVLDMSSSMLAEDFKPNRLEASKEVAKTFIKDRSGDRLGIIIFAGQSFIQCPLTIDSDVLVEFVDKIEVAQEDYDGTAIGMAIANATNRLRFSDSKNKLMILLSDGSNNKGEIEPITAAELAQKFNIKIYTIGAGSMGKAPYPVKDIWGRTSRRMIDVDVDEETLKEISRVTNAKFFRATDNETLLQVYKEIDQLERTEIEVSEYKNYKELYVYFALSAALLLIIKILFNQIFFRKFF